MQGEWFCAFNNHAEVVLHTATIQHKVFRQLFSRRRFVLGVTTRKLPFVDLFWREAKRCSVRTGAFLDHNFLHHHAIIKTSSTVRSGKHRVFEWTMDSWKPTRLGWAYARARIWRCGWAKINGWKMKGELFGLVLCVNLQDFCNSTIVIMIVPRFIQPFLSFCPNDSLVKFAMLGRSSECNSMHTKCPILSTLHQHFVGFSLFGWVGLPVSMAIERWPRGLVAQRSGSMGKSPDGPWWGRWLVTRCDLKIFHVVMVTWLLVSQKWNPFTDIRIICIERFRRICNFQVAETQNWKHKLQPFRSVRISGGLGVPSLLRVWHPGAQSGGHRGRVVMFGQFGRLFCTARVLGRFVVFCFRWNPDLSCTEAEREHREQRNWADLFQSKKSTGFLSFSFRAPLSDWWMLHKPYFWTFGCLYQHGLRPGPTNIASLLK